MGDPPALPGRLPEFDSFGIVRGFAISNDFSILGKRCYEFWRSKRMSDVDRATDRDDGRLGKETALAKGLAKLAGFEPAPKMQASGFAGGR